MVELEGMLSGERDLDADAGALLLMPQRVVETAALDTRLIAAIRERLGHGSGAFPPPCQG